MCKDCGCSATVPDSIHSLSNHDISQVAGETKTLEVFTKILKANDEQAEINRRHLDEHGILAINLMSSPGSGKTTLLEKTIDSLRDKFKIGVIEGDLETQRDADRIRAKGIPAHQITTGQACHLDAFMVHMGIHQLPIEKLEILFIENVGNLVCPASYDVGAHLDVVLLSVAEGDDKAEKYPVIFKKANLLVITKIDLLPYLDFNTEKVVHNARKINPKIDIINLSCKTDEGMETWYSFLALKKTLRINFAID